jgi:polyferredoxin
VFEIRDKDRVRILSAVATRGPSYQVLRVAVITASNLLLLAVPLLGLVRVDLWGGHHLLLGQPVTAFVALRGFVIAMAVLWGVTFATNIVVGRFFCGWGCPVGYTSRLGEDVHLKQKRRGRWLLSHLAGAGFVATFVGALMLWWVDPRVLIDGSWTARLVTLGVFAVLWAGGFLHAFTWRFGFCRSACPIGLYYRYMTSSSPVGIVFSNQPSPCIECGACEKICPVDIDPKRLGEPLPAPGEQAAGREIYGDAECIRCGDCIEACRMIFKSRAGQTPPLRFGRVARKD